MANETDLINYKYNTTMLTDNIVDEYNPLVAIWKATNEYTSGVLEYVIILLFMSVFIMVLRYYEVQYKKAIAISSLSVTVLVTLMAAMEVATTQAFVLCWILTVFAILYYKYTD